MKIFLLIKHGITINQLENIYRNTINKLQFLIILIYIYIYIYFIQYLVFFIISNYINWIII